jgi:hypothetical protein
MTHATKASIYILYKMFNSVKQKNTGNTIVALKNKQLKQTINGTDNPNETNHI